MRLQQKLQAEVERRERLCRHLSESESSLEMDEERFYNENFNLANQRQRTISSPVPNSPSSSSRPLSPGAAAATSRCYACGQHLGRRTSERFIKPAVPCLNTSAPNVMSSMSSGSGSIPMNIGAHNSTLPANINNSSIQFAANNVLTQPASPMDTSVYSKD